MRARQTLLFLLSALAACRSTGSTAPHESGPVATDAPRDAAGVDGAAAGVSSDAGDGDGSAAIDGGDAGPTLKLLGPQFADDLKKCAKGAFGGRSGYFGAFVLHVTIDIDDAGAIRVHSKVAPIISGGESAGETRLESDESCLGRVAARFAAESHARGHFRVDVRDAPGGRVVTPYRPADP